MFSEDVEDDKDYIKEIETVFSDSSKLFVLGYRMRVMHLYGFTQDTPNEWAVCRSIKDPQWVHPFTTRGEAREFLKRSWREKNIDMSGLTVDN